MSLLDSPLFGGESTNFFGGESIGPLDKSLGPPTSNTPLSKVSPTSSVNDNSFSVGDLDIVVNIPNVSAMPPTPDRTETTPTTTDAGAVALAAAATTLNSDSVTIRQSHLDRSARANELRFTRGRALRQQQRNKNKAKKLAAKINKGTTAARRKQQQQQQQRNPVESHLRTWTLAEASSSPTSSKKSEDNDTKTIIAIKDGILVKNPIVDKRARAKACALLKQRHKEEQLAVKRRLRAQTLQQNMQREHHLELERHRLVQEQMERIREQRRLEAWEMKKLVLLRRSEKSAAMHRQMSRRVDRDTQKRHTAALRRRITLQAQESQRIAAMVNRFEHEADETTNVFVEDSVYVEDEHHMRDDTEKSVDEQHIFEGGSEVGDDTESEMGTPKAIRNYNQIVRQRKEHDAKMLQRKKRSGVTITRRLTRPLTAPSTTRLGVRKSTYTTFGTSHLNDSEMNETYRSLERSILGRPKKVKVHTSKRNRQHHYSNKKRNSSSVSESRWQRAKREAQARREYHDLKQLENDQKRKLLQRTVNEKIQLRRAEKELEELTAQAREDQRKRTMIVEDSNDKVEVIEKEDIVKEIVEGGENVTETECNNIYGVSMDNSIVLDCVRDFNADNIEPIAAIQKIQHQTSLAAKKISKQIDTMENQLVKETKKRKALQKVLRKAKKKERKEKKNELNSNEIRESSSSSFANSEILKSSSKSSDANTARWKRALRANELIKANDVETQKLALRRKMLINELINERKKQKLLEKKNQFQKKQKIEKIVTQKITETSTATTTEKKTNHNNSTSHSNANKRQLNTMLKREIKGVMRVERQKFANERSMLVNRVADTVEKRIEKVLVDKLSKIELKHNDSNGQHRQQKSQRQPRKIWNGRGKKAIGNKMSRFNNKVRSNNKTTSIVQKKEVKRTKVTKVPVSSIATQSTPSLDRRQQLAVGDVLSGGDSVMMNQTDDSVFGEDFNNVGGWEELQDLLAFHSPAPSVKKKSLRPPNVGIGGTGTSTPKSGSTKKIGKKKKMKNQRKKKKSTLTNEIKNEISGTMTPKKDDQLPESVSPIVEAGNVFDEKMAEQRRKWDQERLDFEERLKELQNSALSPNEAGNALSSASKLLNKKTSSPTGGTGEADNEYSEIDDSMDASNLVSSLSPPRADVVTTVIEEEEKLGTAAAAAANNFTDVQEAVNIISSPSPAKSSGNESNAENSICAVNGNEFSESYSTPPRSKKRPINTPPPSLFKTDIVDSVVEQHELRAESTQQQLSFSDDDDDENNNGRQTGQIVLGSVTIVNQSPDE